MTIQRVEATQNTLPWLINPKQPIQGIIPYKNIKGLEGSKVKKLMYHGGNHKFTKFQRPPWGVFVTPHFWSADYYSSSRGSVHKNAPKASIVYPVYIFAPRIITFNSSKDTFLQDYEEIQVEMPKLMHKGYFAAQQLMTESQMMCVFHNAKMYSALTGELM